MPEKTFPPYPITPQLNITNMYSFFRTHYEQDFDFPGETHNFWECLYVLDGEFQVSADERIYHMKQGELIFHKPLELHKFHVSIPSGVTLLTFSFSMDGPLTGWFQDKVFFLTSAQRDLMHALITYAEDTLQLSARNDTAIDQKNDRALNYYLQPFGRFPHYSQVIGNYFHLLFLSLYENGELSPESFSPDALLFREAVRYMNANLSCQLSVPDIAQHCSISDSSLKRLFDRYAGISVHAYFLTLRINAAIRLLEAGCSVTDISNQLGFNSQSYFSKAFKRVVGVSPSLYREG